MSLDKVQIENSKLPHARFDMSKSHYTTFNWGEVSPTMVRTLDTPDQKVTFSSFKLARLNPLVSPTWGKIRLKEYYQFVPWRTIFKGCNSFLSQVARKPDWNKLASRASQLPRIETCVFMYYLTRYGLSHSWMWGRSGDGNTANNWTLMSNNFYWVWDAIFPTLASTRQYLDPNSGSGCENVNNVSWANSEWQLDPSNADYRCCGRNTSQDLDLMFAMNLTQRGLRFQKLILGCGLPISFQPDMYVSALHLFAVYRAYFDIFQIKQYWNWEETGCYELIRFYDTNNPSSLNDASLANFESNDDLRIMWFRFFDELLDMYYTANVDNLSSQLPTDWTLGASELRDLEGLTELYGMSGTTTNSSTDPNVQPINIGGNPINPNLVLAQSAGASVFDQFTDEFMKKAYYYCNKKTQLGYDIANLLKAKGMGGYVDLMDSGFIGKSETSLTVNEVISTADTQLRNLGDYAGQSSKMENTQSFHYHNSEVGVLVALAVVVPDSHWSNCPDMSQFACTPQEFYNPIFDGLGYEAMPRIGVGHDEAQFHQKGTPNLAATFGLYPRYQGTKVNNDTRTGMFALRSVRNAYNPFHMAKIVTCHENEVLLNGTISAQGAFKDGTQPLEPNSIETFPNAGEQWRFVGKYEYLGHFQRIFYQDAGVNPDWFRNSSDIRYPQDGFMVFFEFNFNLSAPKLPCSKTFETICEETEDNHTWTATK
ncbi:MAG: major capsid protein [Sulfolobaceae archaeon]